MLKDRLGDSKNTARSILVTVFGDTVLASQNELWLAQLFQLTRAFSYSDRLARTSMFRLASEGWFTSERIGRQSRYTLTPLAIEESQRATARIYTPAQQDWHGSWTVAFLGALSVDERARVRRHLRWNGFIELSKGMLGSPTATIHSTTETCASIEPARPVPVAVLEFADLDQIVADGFFDVELDFAAISEAYRRFVRWYEPLVDPKPSWTPAEAFALRTVFVQDLRRIRLNGPDMPAALLPVDWAGDDAYRLAKRVYPALSATAAPWLSEVLDVDYPASFPERFKEIAKPVEPSGGEGS